MSRLRRAPDRLGRLSSAGLILGLVAMLVVADPVAPAWAAERTVGEFSTRLDRRIGELMEEYDVPGVAVALVREGELVWSNAYGYADITADRPMTVDTVNRAESISKSVTAWGVMTLVQEGRLGLDEPIVAHVDERLLPETRFPIDEVTVRQLLSHTGGVSLGTIGREYQPGAAAPALAQSLRDELQLVGQAGSGFLYSNTGFNLLELLMEEVAGEEFAKYMQREVLGPLGMNHSSFTWSEDLVPPVPVGYDLEGNPVPVYVYPEKASGGLFATVEDVARFVAAGMTGPDARDNDVLQPATIRQMHRPEAEITGLFRVVSPSYGLGHFLETLSSGEQVVWHGGQGHGWMTDFHFIPATGDGIVVMANSQRSWPLIAGILSDWSQWNGFSPVGFAIITRATAGLWVVIGVIGLGSVLQWWRLGSGLVRGSRRVAPLSRQSRMSRLVQVLLSASLLFVVVWDRAQDYSFVSSVFPTASGWLGAALLGLGFVILLSALTPEIEPRGNYRALDSGVRPDRQLPTRSGERR